MYNSAYSDMAAETTANIRDNEKAAFERSIALLKSAQSKGRGSRESVEALLFVSRLWSLLLEDLAAEENGLPPALRASIISIGIWVLRRAEEIRLGTSDDFSALIEVSQSICSGLEGI